MLPLTKECDPLRGSGEEDPIRKDSVEGGGEVLMKFRVRDSRLEESESKGSALL